MNAELCSYRLAMRDLIASDSAASHPKPSRAVPRIALYSHDTMGLGHMRRNLLIAGTLRQSALRPDVLMITGAHAANGFAMPPGIDCLTLPALYKESDGQYRPRRLAIPLPELLALRTQTMVASLRAFEPDVLIVDNVPRGAIRELDPVLKYLRANGGTRCVLGLRDVLDEPGVVQREWHRAANESAIRDFYDAIWVYGDPSVYDMVSEYDFPQHVKAKIQFTGYLDPRLRTAPTQAEQAQLTETLALPPGKLVLGLVGGGQDGARLAEAFAQMELPKDTNAVLITGPFMPDDKRSFLRDRCSINTRLRVLDFLPEPTVLLGQADRVIAMGGYNTICEILAFNKRALIVPRVSPRREQWIRARRLHRLGLIDTLHPDHVDARRLSKWLARDLQLRAPDRKTFNLKLNGLSYLPKLLDQLLGGSRPANEASIP